MSISLANITDYQQHSMELVDTIGHKLERLQPAIKNAQMQRSLLAILGTVAALAATVAFLPATGIVLIGAAALSAVAGGAAGYAIGDATFIAPIRQEMEPYTHALKQTLQVLHHQKSVLEEDMRESQQRIATCVAAQPQTVQKRFAERLAEEPAYGCYRK